MIRTILNFLSALLFYCGITFTKLKGLWRPLTKQHKKVKVTKLALKEGQSYRLGECVVTLAKFGIEGKQEVAKKIAYWEQVRKDREEKYKQKAIDIMLMTPEQLKQYQVESWIQQRKAFNEKKFYENLSDNYQEKTKA